MEFSIYQASHQGARDNNEDRVAYSYTRDALLMVLADGMGGHARGEIAAQIAVSTITEFFQLHAQTQIINPYDFLYDAFIRAHKAINLYAAQHNLDEFPHTTCVACLIQNDTAWWAHAGDSRLYLFSDHQLLIRTYDHSAVQRLLDEKAITEKEIPYHPDRNKIYHSLGGQIALELEISDPMPLSYNDRILICTDGLWSQVSQEQIAKALFNLPPHRAVESLLSFAEEQAGVTSDNLSAIALIWGPSKVMHGDEVTTIAMMINDITTQHGALPTHAFDLNEDEVDDLIAEIQQTLNKTAISKK